MFAKLQYISQGDTAAAQEQHIREALEAGCRWIQLRFKKAAGEQLVGLAGKIRDLCTAYQATFIVNDHPAIARASGADGVHLGLQDMPVQEARKIVGAAAIIGGTANAFSDILQRYQEGCQYIGVGPFRFTTTKEKLSPVLGIGGFRMLMDKMAEQGVELPVYAIGGIHESDIGSIMQTGVYGVAMSGAITHHPGKKQLVQQINADLYATAHHSR